MFEPIALMIAFGIIVFAIYAVFRLIDVHHEVVNLFKLTRREPGDFLPDRAKKETLLERHVKPERSEPERDLSRVD